MNLEINFYNFMEIMKELPTLQQLDEYCKNDSYIGLFEYLESIEYFKLLTPIQKYHLFTTACGHNSYLIAKILYNNDIDYEGLIVFMINYFAEIGQNNEFNMFKWIWSFGKIQLSIDEENECFIKILKSGNLDFAQWFYSLKLININSEKLKNRIYNEFLLNANCYIDYKISHWICLLLYKL